MTDLIDRLAEHKTVGAAPREELAWLASHGTLRHLAEGEVLSPKGVQVEGMFIVLEGHIAIFVDRGAGRHKIIEWHTGDVAGLLPYSRLVGPPGDSTAQKPTTIVAIPRDDMRAMIRECHTVTSILVHKMVDRARIFTSSDLHDEKMMSLGKLSAGLAHELNNPVAAIERSAATLEDRLEEVDQTTRTLGASGLTESQIASLASLRTACLETRHSGVLSPMEQLEREEAIGAWLAAHGIDERIAGELAETPVTVAKLDEFARVAGEPALDAALRWAAAVCAVRELTSDIRDAATRISGLVAAIKGFTHMDQAAVAGPVDLAQSLQNTVAVLSSKARTKSVAISVKIEPGLPQVQGFVGELNQIWVNLIDNALDAAPHGGRVEVSAVLEHQRVRVTVADNGSGIPPDVRARIFDPFFTTKPVGQGTGLGLDIVRRLVTNNEAAIDVESEPGRTEFNVRLRIADAAAGAQS